MTGFSREFVLARVFVHQTGGNTRVLVVDRGRSVLHHGTQSEMYSSPPYVNETPYRDDITGPIGRGAGGESCYEVNRGAFVYRWP